MKATGHVKVGNSEIYHSEKDNEMTPIVNIFAASLSSLQSYCYRQMGRPHLCIRAAYDATFGSSKFYDTEEEEREHRGCELIFPKEAYVMRAETSLIYWSLTV